MIPYVPADPRLGDGPAGPESLEFELDVVLLLLAGELVLLLPHPATTPAKTSAMKQIRALEQSWYLFI